MRVLLVVMTILALRAHAREDGHASALRHGPTVELTGGPLLRTREGCRRAFYELIDPMARAKALDIRDRQDFIDMEGKHLLASNAEPEFTGHYLDLCARYLELDHDERVRRKAEVVLDAVARNTSKDGYLGGMSAGRETDSFGIWSHAHMVYGLSRWAAVSSDARAKAFARRAADWLETTLGRFASAALIDPKTVGNDGSQHLVSIYALVVASEALDEPRYLERVRAILRSLDSTAMNLLSFDDILDLQSKKGIEMIGAFRGMLACGCRCGEQKMIASAERAWNGIAAGQIRNTGNGTLRERFCAGGNAPAILPTAKRPNENCVACGWLRFSAELNAVCPRAAIGDEIERSLYNHLLGSVADDGSDFAYYQGNCGNKVFGINFGYECCRYRGFAVFAHLEEMLFRDDGAVVSPTIYAPMRHRAADGFELELCTEYPADGVIRLTAKGGQKGRTIRLRIPSWCESPRLTGVKAKRNGRLFGVDVSAGETKAFTLELPMRLREEEVTIDGRKYLSYSWGPLVLTRDSHDGPFDPIPAGLTFAKVESNGVAIVRFVAKTPQGDAVTLVDFASAGRRGPGKDTYEVFMEKKQKSPAITGSL